MLYIYASYLFYFKDKIYFTSLSLCKVSWSYQVWGLFSATHKPCRLLILVEFCHLRAAAKNDISQCGASNLSSSQTDIIIIPWVHASQSAKWLFPFSKARKKKFWYLKKKEFIHEQKEYTAKITILVGSSFVYASKSIEQVDQTHHCICRVCRPSN